MNIEHLRHSEVVAFIKAGEQEVRLLVIDQETDELFHRLGITPTACHVYFQFLVTKVLTLFVRYSGRSINACVKKKDWPSLKESGIQSNDVLYTEEHTSSFNELEKNRGNHFHRGKWFSFNTIVGAASLTVS